MKVSEQERLIHTLLSCYVRKVIKKIDKFDILSILLPFNK